MSTQKSTGLAHAVPCDRAGDIAMFLRSCRLRSEPPTEGRAGLAHAVRAPRLRTIHRPMTVARAQQRHHKEILILSGSRLPPRLLPVHLSAQLEQSGREKLRGVSPCRPVPGDAEQDGAVVEQVVHVEVPLHTSVPELEVLREPQVKLVQ